MWKPKGKKRVSKTGISSISRMYLLHPWIHFGKVLHPKRGISSAFSSQAPPSSPTSSSCLSLRRAGVGAHAIPSVAMPSHVIPNMVPRHASLCNCLLLKKSRCKAPLRTDRPDDLFFCMCVLPPQLCRSKRYFALCQLHLPPRLAQ